MISIESQFKKIISQWFYTEPLLFSAVCTHTLVENKNLSVPIRSGNFHIEYSQENLENCSDLVLEEYLKIEVMRILLLHPYQRQPLNCKKSILLMASDVTIAQMYQIPGEIKLPGVEYMKSRDSAYARVMQTSGKTDSMYADYSYEQWYKIILNLVKESLNGENAGNGGYEENILAEADDMAELWEEDENALNTMQNEIKKAEIDQGWGGIGGTLQRQLSDSCDFSFDYRRALTQFRQNIVSASRKLTRMRPSRRYGFKTMGSRYERKANILIAVDVSGSITDVSFEHFTHAIKNFFFLGLIEKIDLIFFDVNLKNTKPVRFRSNIDFNMIQGRGGTCFQPPIDFLNEHLNEYSGMIIFTDGQGDIPVIKNCKNLLWILDSRLSWEKSKSWLLSLSDCKAAYLPF